MYTSLKILFYARSDNRGAREMSRVAEPLQCSGCGANLKPKEDGSGLWKCEFCGKPHVVDMLGNIYAIEIKGSVEVFQGNAEKERLAKNAERRLFTTGIQEFRKCASFEQRGSTSFF